MILHSKVAKLYQYIGDPAFDRVMGLMGGALEEGLTKYEIDVKNLDEDIKFDLFAALEAMAYTYDYDMDEEVIYVTGSEG